MTTTIMKDKDWLKNEIEKGVDAFIESEYDYIVNLLMRYVYKQIYITGCSLNTANSVDEPAKLHIVLDIPLPSQCNDAIDNISRNSILFDFD